MLHIEFDHISEKLSIFSRLKSLMVILISLGACSIGAQSELLWEDLEEVTFEEKFIDSTDTYWLIPDFSETILSYESADVMVEGYMVYIDLEDNFSILSKYPFASCFFCGGAGPESIVEIQFKKKTRGLSIDKYVRIKGRLILNKDDFEHFNYILSDAELIK